MLDTLPLSLATITGLPMSHLRWRAYANFRIKSLMIPWRLMRYYHLTMNMVGNSKLKSGIS